MAFFSIYAGAGQFRPPRKVVFRSREVLDQVRTEGLEGVFSSSRHIRKMCNASFDVTGVQYAGQGEFKMCHRITMEKEGQQISLALLTAKQQVSMGNEFEFYRRYKGVRYFPRVYELSPFREPLLAHGKVVFGCDFIVREFIDAPLAISYRNDKVAMMRYLRAVRALMMAGIKVEDEMDVANLNNAFFLQESGTFRFIDHRTGGDFYEVSVSRLIRGLSSGSLVERRRMLRMFLGLPEFQRWCGSTVEQVEQYWADIDSLP